VATAAAAPISAGGGATASTAAPPAAAWPPSGHLSTPLRGGRRFHIGGRRGDVGCLARCLGRVIGGRRRRRRRFCGRGRCGVRRRASGSPPAVSPPHFCLEGGAGRLPHVASGSSVDPDEPRWFFGVGGGIRRQSSNFGRQPSHNNPRRADCHPPALPSAWNCDRGARYWVCRVGGGLGDELVVRRQSRGRRAVRRRRFANGHGGFGPQASPDSWRSRGYAAAAYGCPLSSGRAGGPPPPPKRLSAADMVGVLGRRRRPPCPPSRLPVWTSTTPSPRPPRRPTKADRPPSRPRRRPSPLPSPRPGPPRRRLPPQRCRRQRAPRRRLRRRCRRRPRGRLRTVAALPPPIARVLVLRQVVVLLSQSDAPGQPQPGSRVRSPPPAAAC